MKKSAIVEEMTPNGCGEIRRGKEFMTWILAFLVVVFVSILSRPADAAEKITIGAVEEVILFPWGLRIPARIDTGATTSSLDVCDYSVKDNSVSFTLAGRCGGYKARLPLVGWKDVHTSEGRDRRPVVKMDICLGPRRLKTQVTLNNRSGMDFPFLVGRKTLRGRFIVDVSRAKIFPPDCPDSKSP
jgi:hypothetical protein